MLTRKDGIQDEITLQRPVMQQKYDTYMARFMKVH